MLTRHIGAEEIINSATHGFGLVLSLVGFAVLWALAAMHGGAWRIASCTIYGSSLVCLYTASTLYHGVSSKRLKRALKIFDHSAIYLLIAGTYTPFLLVNLRGDWGWSIFGIIWGLAMAGVAFQFWFVNHFRVLSTAIYVGMGWLALIAAKPILQHVSARGIELLVAGGLLYTIGVVFFATRRVPYHHAIWHAFVLAGSICHYFAVLYSVILTTKA